MPHPAVGVPLFLLCSFASAVAACGLFVWIYNRALSKMHETAIKKVIALAVLPLGCLIGVAAGAWATWGRAGVPRAASGVLVLAGGLLVVRYALVSWKKRRLSRGSEFHPLGQLDAINWRYLAGPRAALLRLLRPINGVGNLRLHRRVVPVPGLPPEFAGYRIVHLTDLHLHPTLRARWYRRVVREAMRQGPDLLLFGGDFISRRRHLALVPRVLRRLSAPDGVWCVRGNHDFWKAPQATKRLARALGMGMLSNEGIVLRRGGAELALVGLEHPYLPISPRERAALERLPHPRLALVHTPDAYRAAEELGCALALAGHTHGGQVRLPLFGTTVSATAAGPMLASGVGRLRAMKTITSNGQGAFFPLRVNCPPEIVVVDLQPA